MVYSLKKEILRKLFHLLGIPLLLIYSYARFFWDEHIAIMVLTALFLVLLEIEYIRLEVRPKLPRIMNVLRPREKNNVTGTVYFISATIIAFSAFNFSVALLALLLTVFGDLVSALVGIKYGKIAIFHKKTLEGTIAGFVANIIIGLLIMPTMPMIYIPMALVASFVELTTNKLDDNLTVPLFSGFTGQMIVYIFAIVIQPFPHPFGWLFTFL